MHLTVELNRVFPGDGDQIAIPSGGPGTGLPVSAGPGYLFSIGGTELDTFSDDNLGGLDREIHEQDGWGPLGTYDERGQLCQLKGFFHHTSDCTSPAAFSVEYEIRRTPLPDLQPTAFRVADELPGDRDDQVCFTVQNNGPLASDPFHVSIGVEGAYPPSWRPAPSGWRQANRASSAPACACRTRAAIR